MATKMIHPSGRCQVRQTLTLVVRPIRSLMNFLRLSGKIPIPVHCFFQALVQIDRAGVIQILPGQTDVGLGMFHVSGPRFIITGIDIRANEFSDLQTEVLHRDPTTESDVVRATAGLGPRRAGGQVGIHFGQKWVNHVE